MESMPGGDAAGEGEEEISVGGELLSRDELVSRLVG
jgi:hypothetical protein